MRTVRIAGLIMLLAFTALGSWKARGWLEDSKRLTAMQAATAAIDAAMSRESEIAANVEQRLAELQGAERVIDRGIIREIEKPVYRNVCLEPDAIRLLNDAAAGRSPGNTANPADPLPATPAATN